MKGSDMLVLRRARRVRQHEVARGLGVGQQTVRDLENNKLLLSPESYEKWKRAIEAQAQGVQEAA